MHNQVCVGATQLLGAWPNVQVALQDLADEALLPNDAIVSLAKDILANKIKNGKAAANKNRKLAAALSESENAAPETDSMITSNRSRNPSLNFHMAPAQWTPDESEEVHLPRAMSEERLNDLSSTNDILSTLENHAASRQFSPGVAFNYRAPAPESPVNAVGENADAADEFLPLPAPSSSSSTAISIMDRLSERAANVGLLRRVLIHIRSLANGQQQIWTAVLKKRKTWTSSREQSIDY